MKDLHIYKIKGMHCVACASTIERKLMKNPEIKEVAVSYTSETVNLSTPLSLSELNKEIILLGYSLEEMKRSQEPDQVLENKINNFPTNIRIIVPLMIVSAVFMTWEIFGKMYGLIPAMQPWLVDFFHHLVPLMALYMLVVVGRPFLVALGRFIRFGQANMDTLIGLGTTAAFVYSFIISAFEEQLRPFLDVNTMYYDVTIIVIGFITLGKYLEAKAKAKTNQALKSLVSLQAKIAIVERDGQEISIPLEEVKVGDRVIIKSGEKIPVDGLVIEGQSYVDESMMTGEVMPIEKQAGEQVIGGTINQDGRLIIKATAIGSASVLARIITLVETAQNSRAPIQKMADKISAIFVPIVLVIAVISLLGWLLIGSRYMPLSQALALGMSGFITVLVIACPCALGLATPTAIIVGVGKGARQGILIKNAEALEKLSKVRHIIFDKTGTLTKGTPEVLGFNNVSSQSDDQIIALARSLEQSSNHPLALAIEKFAQNKEIDLKFDLINYKTLRGKGISAEIENTTYNIGSDTYISEVSKNKLDTMILSNKEYQSLTPVVLASSENILAYFFIGDEIKNNAKQAISTLHAYGILTHIATGDRESTTKEVADILGIDSYHARLLPEDKQKLVNSLKSKEGIVAVAGDGINDAPALAAADVGIAMATGTDVAIETADITLLHGDISKVVQSIVLSKQTLRTIKQNLVWAFLFNIIGIPLAAGAFYSFGVTLNPVFAGAAMAFSSVLVVSNSLRLKLSSL